MWALRAIHRAVSAGRTRRAAERTSFDPWVPAETSFSTRRPWNGSWNIWPVRCWSPPYGCSGGGHRRATSGQLVACRRLRRDRPASRAGDGAERRSAVHADSLRTSRTSRCASRAGATAARGPRMWRCITTCSGSTRARSRSRWCMGRRRRGTGRHALFSRRARLSAPSNPTIGCCPISMASPQRCGVSSPLPPIMARPRRGTLAVECQP